MEPNVRNIVLGEHHIKPDYPSFYPEDMVGGKKTEWLYVCQSCFRYTNELLKYSAHCVGPYRNGMCVSVAQSELMAVRKSAR